jgi:hypothetical protein
MATIFDQCLKELDDVKRGLSASNAQLFKGAIQAAEKAEDALKGFMSASETAKSHLADMLKVQAILEGKQSAGSRRGRKPSLCLKCGKPATGGRVGRFCVDHKDLPAAEKEKLKKAA